MKKTFKDICKLAEKLRSGTGCPWDRAQTIETMLDCLKNETSEVAEAVLKKDYRNLKEELGDVLFQIVMIAQIAKEQKHFKIDDVIKDIDKKIRSRHTWVFGEDKAKTPEEAIAMWKRNKSGEKNR
ncbi:nucleotide pyrophosphohydrolase [Candidatus Peregrinibacteria bacterium RIFCSPLOWO2_02_FULL_39_10]|nr:MAG: nucleotide pyrophosphohydrolase [Candidatus Peregrinibacteria bacterium RIFCSPLOWO2_02_FULL_39_10]